MPRIMLRIFSLGARSSPGQNAREAFGICVIARSAQAQWIAQSRRCCNREPWLLLLLEN